ncbi:hypothetical protein BO78DRAFT_337813 [Aspergillus sclerotiicarbonarius CBS 121057]|uniref:Protein kinase domain-containing protein n=1 Tax=Aspergillus sclerotiicarbonarius (strain CBS 121057 / IBT 28362) TaxID=1448318 RepID=A0A319ENA2_ASPSB|nr:hypothetical protein BO78DRAFT_337813 [Aspergillus sclerotiicarbonarius CBS 121057]
MDSEYFDWVEDFELRVQLAKTSTPTEWRMSPIAKEKIRIHENFRHGTIEEVTGVCKATQIAGPSPGQEAIVKIKIQLSHWEDETRDLLSPEAYRETNNLSQLTDEHCSSTPAFIARAQFVQGDDGHLPGGYIVFILMERVPGRDLGCFPELTLEERDQARIAFIKALWEFRSHGFLHRDPRRENIIWDRDAQKCYIVDLEDAEDCKLKRTGIDPRLELSLWNLHGRQSQSAENHLDDDAMIPPEREEGSKIYDRDELLALLINRATQRSV